MAIISRQFFVASAIASSAWAFPFTSEPSILSIPISDIATNNLTAHEAHPVFPLYIRWIENDRNSAMLRRNAQDIHARYPTLDSIDCHEDLDTCFFTSSLPLNSPSPPTETNHNPAGSLFKRQSVTSITDYTPEIHYKTYIYLENEDGEEQYVGFETYIDWDWKCNIMTYKSTGGQYLMEQYMNVTSAPVYHYGTVIFGAINMIDNQPQQVMTLVATFRCGFFGTNCCLDGGYETLTIDGKDSDWAADPERTCNNMKRSGTCPTSSASPTAVQTTPTTAVTINTISTTTAPTTQTTPA